MKECKQCECQYPDSYTKCPSCGSTSWKTVLRKERYVEHDDLGNERQLLTVVASDYERYDLDSH